MNRLRTYHGAGIIFWTHTKKGEIVILLGKRSMESAKPPLVVPGGGWETADGYESDGNISYKAAARRESIEEMGMKVSDPSALR
jgi:8-oxo-dGTP pyrophosphatase MutT (NUDIX family)